MARKSQPKRPAAFDREWARIEARRAAEEADLQAKLASVTPLTACQEIAVWWGELNNNEDMWRATFPFVSVPTSLIRAAVAAAENATKAIR